MPHQHESGISATVAALVSGAASTLLTIAATLVSLRSDASKTALFDVLNLMMYVSAAGLTIFLIWLISDSIASRIRRLRHLQDVEAHIPRHLRIKRRNDYYMIRGDGSAIGETEWEVESEDGASVPWIGIPIVAGSPIGAQPWAAIEVIEMSVDGRGHSRPQQAFIRKSRINRVDLESLVMEEGIVRVPINLGRNRRSCTIRLRIHMPNAFADIMTKDWYIVDIAYVTDELNVHISGSDGLEVRCSPTADHLVKASQPSGEVFDATESQVQSQTCRGDDSIIWRSTSAKIGYRYEISLYGQQVGSS
jgi:hypothetical protein